MYTHDTLSGIRVLDLSRLLPGPFCSMLLADLGADVIKVEDPNGGDYLRWFPPVVGESSAQFVALNRGKRSLCLDLKQAEGQALLLRLLETTDVLLEGFRPGVMARLGLDPRELCARFSRLVICSISGYGQTGPWSQKAGHDVNYLAVGGLYSLMGQSARLLPIQVADIAGGSFYAALGILSALFARERTGKGRWLDVSMTEGAMSLLGPTMAQAWAEQRSPRAGQELLTGGAASYQLYETADGRFLAVGSLEPKFWEMFTNVIGRPDLRDRGLDLNDEEAKQLVAETIREKTSAEWEVTFARYDACVEPVLQLDELANHPQHESRDAIREGEDGFPQIANPLSARTLPLKAAPRLGEHSIEILRALGIDDEHCKALLARKVVSI